MSEHRGNRLDGKVAIITGGGSDIGRAGSVLFAREGCRVAVADIDLGRAEAIAAAISEEGGEALPLAVDVGDAQQVEAMLVRTEEHFGGVDILFTNAVDAHLVKQRDAGVVDLEESVFDDIHRVILRGVFLCSKYAGQAMIRRGGGAMVFTVSVDAQVGCANLDAYTAAKGGVLALTRSMAASLASNGIRVNAISPGFVNTEAQASFMNDPSGREQLERLHLLSIPDPEDVVPMALFLASDEAKSITGSIHQVDAGYTAFKTKEIDVVNVMREKSQQ